MKRKTKNISEAKAEFNVNPFFDLNFQGKLEPIHPAQAQAKSSNSDSENPKVKAASKQVLFIQLSKKGRAGKVVTMIRNFENTDTRKVDQLARKLRKEIGTGGTYNEDTVELQGDHRLAAAEWLKKQGFKVKGEINC